MWVAGRWWCAAGSEAGCGFESRVCPERVEDESMAEVDVEADMARATGTLLSLNAGWDEGELEHSAYKGGAFEQIRPCGLDDEHARSPVLPLSVPSSPEE